MTFSAIVPVYNVAPFLRDCIGSLIGSAAAAGGASVELVCIDDGSTDGSGEVLDELASAADMRAPNVSMRVVHKPNGGVSSARNAAMDEATGDWLVFADADDCVRPTFFADIADAVAVQPDADLLGFGMVAHFGGDIDWSDDGRGFVDVDIGHVLSDELVGMSFCRFAYRRDLVEGTRFRPYAIGEDLVFAAEAFARSRKCMVTHRKEYLYRYREGSATHADVSIAKLQDTVAFHVEMFRVLESSGKRIGRAFAEGRGSMWIEEIPKALLPLRKTPDGRKVWEQWLDSMSVAAGLSCLSESQRRRARRVAASRSAWSVRLNCRLPAWLRRRGVPWC